MNTVSSSAVIQVCWGEAGFIPAMLVNGTRTSLSSSECTRTRSWDIMFTPVRMCMSFPLDRLLHGTGPEAASSCVAAWLGAPGMRTLITDRPRKLTGGLRARHGACALQRPPVPRTVVGIECRHPTPRLGSTRASRPDHARRLTP